MELSTTVIKKKNNLLNTIIFLILGVVLFTNPEGIVNIIPYLVGGVIILIGLVNLLNYHKTKKNLNIENYKNLYFGITLIIIGLVTLIFGNLIHTIIRLVIGAFIVYNGILKLIDAFKNIKKLIIFLITLIAAMLMIYGGLFVLIKSDVFTWLIGLIMIIYCVLDLATYVSNAISRD